MLHLYGGLQREKVSESTTDQGSDVQLHPSKLDKHAECM